jgi:transposase-like protein
MTPKKYTDAEKQQIIEEAKAAGNIKATAKRYSISDSTIHDWMKKDNLNKPTLDLHQEIKRLRKTLADRELENSVLKDLVKKTLQVWTNEEM